MSDEAREGWARLCEQHGISFTAVVEATGRMLLEGRGALADPVEVIALARKIDHERSQR